MIDLRFSELPDSLVCDGEEYKIDTSFRTWIHFEYILRTENIAWDGIFLEEIPQTEWSSAAIEFLKSENPTPRNSQKSLEPTLDLIMDGDYIVSAFQQAYGIDLTSCDMHWHRFNALLIGLPDEVLLSKIRGYRSWKKTKYDHDREMQKLKTQWRLPPRDLQEAKDAILAWADEFFA